MPQIAHYLKKLGQSACAQLLAELRRPIHPASIDGWFTQGPGTSVRQQATGLLDQLPRCGPRSACLLVKRKYRILP